jgi:Mlc titration factor MtfA (ptsG expression regulator)
VGSGPGVGSRWSGRRAGPPAAGGQTLGVFHRRPGLPDDWREIVAGHVGIWRVLDDAERTTAAEAADWLLRHKHWEAAHGFELTPAMTVTVAVQGALLVLDLGVEELRELSAVIVYPTAMRSMGARLGPISGTVSDGPLPILGEAHDRRGPVLVAWDRAEIEAREPGHGGNVVLHEFAHKLDMVDHVIDGRPPLHDRVDPQRWFDVCREAFVSMQRGDDRAPLDPYGATDPAEFFAVATETFFDVPVALEQHEPDLYAVLRDYYGQDPAARLRRAG